MPQQSQTFILSTNQISCLSGRSRQGFKIGNRVREIANPQKLGMHLRLQSVMESNKTTSTLAPCTYLQWL